MSGIERSVRGGLALLLAIGLAACGSQSQAGEAEEAAGGSEQAAATETAAAETGAGPGAFGSAAEEPAAEVAPGAARNQKASAAEPAPAKLTRQPRTETAAPPRDEPAAETEAAPEATAEPEAVPEPARVTIASGTVIPATLDGEISTRTATAGDSFSATVSAPVLEGRTVLIPQGATLRGEVTGVQKKSGDQKAGLALAFRTITIEGEPYTLEASLAAITPKTEREMKDEGKKIGGGAAAGGLLGAIIGGDAKGAVIGAAAGAAAGTAVTLVTREEHAVLPAGTAMELRLEESLEVGM